MKQLLSSPIFYPMRESRIRRRPLGRMKKATLGLLLFIIALFFVGPAAKAQSWTSNGPTDAAVWSLVIDPTNPSTVYAGTYGGIFKSTDSGGSWTATSLIGSSSYPVYLTMDPQVSTTLYASFGLGFYKSIDGGASWSPITGPTVGFNMVIAVDPLVSTTLYAGIIEGSSAYKSTDGGANWTSIYPGSSFVVSSLVIDPSNPATIYLGGGARCKAL